MQASRLLFPRVFLRLLLLMCLRVSSAGYLRELVLTDNEDGLEDLPSEDLGLNEGDGLAVEADETLALFAVGDGGSRLLLAEARYGRSRHDD